MVNIATPHFVDIFCQPAEVTFGHINLWPFDPLQLLLAISCQHISLQRCMVQTGLSSIATVKYEMIRATSADGIQSIPCFSSNNDKNGTEESMCGVHNGIANTKLS